MVDIDRHLNIKTFHKLETSWRNHHFAIFFIRTKSVSQGKNKIACQVLTRDLIFPLEAKYFIHCSLAWLGQREEGWKEADVELGNILQFVFYLDIGTGLWTNYE